MDKSFRKIAAEMRADNIGYVSIYKIHWETFSQIVQLKPVFTYYICW